MDEDVASQLARSAEAFIQSPLDADVRRHVVRAATDWFAAYWAGADAALVRALASGRDPDDPLGDALRSGTASHAAELDDIYAPGTYHPGAPVFASLFEVVGRTSVSGERFVRAVVIGYEIGCMVSADLGPSHYRQWHSTGTVGGIGAAAAAATAWGADAEDLAAAISIAATMAGGLQGTFRHRADVKPLHAGHAAAAGTLAAHLAVQGMRTSPEVLEGPTGLSVGMAGSGGWENCHSAFERPLAIARVTTKPYPCCGHCIAPIDAARELVTQIGPEAAELCEIDIETYGAAVEVAGNLSPADPAAARFSFPHAVAATLLGFSPDVEMFSVAAIERTAGLRERVRIRTGEDFEARFPQRRGARITLRAEDGTSFSATAPDRSGSPERPVSDAELEDKLRRSALPNLGEKVTEQLLHLVRNLPEPTAAERLSRLVRTACSRPADQR